MEALGGNICINTDQSEVSGGVELTAVVYRTAHCSVSSAQCSVTVEWKQGRGAVNGIPGVAADPQLSFANNI